VLLAPVSLNIVCFRYTDRSGTLDDAATDHLNAELVADLHESGLAVPSTTTVGGRTAIRVALVNHRTTAADLDVLLDAVLRLGARRCCPRLAESTFLVETAP
jgi:glutamate/tyrosine decarboxylase-like PLP-dependent enzyme